MFDVTFGIKTKINLKYPKLDHAHHALKRMFISRDSSENIFDFEFKNSSTCKNILEKNKVPREKLDNPTSLVVSADDIDSVSSMNIIDIKILDFLMHLFTVFNMTAGSIQDPSTYVFGKVSEARNIIIDNQEDSDLWYAYSYIYHGEKSIVTEEMCISDLKSWYSERSKGYLTDALDILDDSKRQRLSEYYVIVHVIDKNYCALKITFPDKDSDDTEIPLLEIVVASDFVGQQEEQAAYDKQLKDIRMWYGKFFGLYYKEMCNKPFTNLDFNGSDLRMQVKRKIDGYIPCKDDSDAYLSVQLVQPKFKSEDGLMSDLICIHSCLKWLAANQSKVIHKNLDIKDEVDLSNTYRHRIMCLIHGVYMILHGAPFECLSHYVNLDKGISVDEENIELFKKTHYLFDNDVLIHDHSRNNNANTHVKKKTGVKGKMI